MADSTIRAKKADTNEGISVKARDLGDGTYAQSVAVENSGTPWFNVTSANASGGVDASPAPGVGLKVVDDSILVSTKVAIDCTFSEETSGDVVAKFSFGATNMAPATWYGKVKLRLANKKLRLTTSGAGQVDASIGYHLEV